MKKRMTGVLLAAVFVFSGCQSMETANQKMEVVNKSVTNADATFREKVGLAPYRVDKDNAAPKE